MRVISSVFTPRQFVKAVEEVTGKKIELHETDRARFDAQRSTFEELWAK